MVRRLAAAGALALVLAAGASGRVTANPALAVTFFPNGTISVTLPDGSPLGTSSGPPTVIPGGYYTLQLAGPGGCNELPYFILEGPGENIQNNLELGLVKATVNAYFLPNSTYTWQDNGIPDVLYTFKTSGEIVGSQPVVTTPKPIIHGTGHTTSSNDVVGSGLVPFRGTLVGGVSAAGRLSVAFRGRSITRLQAGRYRITVTDRSSTSGFVVQKEAHTPVAVTGNVFIGKRSRTVRLTSGRWTIRAGSQPGYVVVVR